MFGRKAKKSVNDNFGKQKEDAFSFELIEKYHKNKKHENVLQVVSEQTCKDLDFDELFMFLDRTQSRIGQQYLYDKLRLIPKNADGLKENESIIRAFTKDEQLRREVQKQLEKLNKADAYYITTLFQDKYVEKPKWYFVIPLLAFTSLLSFLLLPFNFYMIFILLPVLIVNLGIHYWNKRLVMQYLGSIPQLIILSGIARKLFKKTVLKSINTDLPRSLQIMRGVRNRIGIFRLEAYLQNEMEAVFWFVLELLKMLFLLEPLLLFNILDKLDKERKAIEALFEFVGKTDALLSIASLRAGLETYCHPEIQNKGIKTEGIYHPLVKDCVRNSVRMEDKSMLLTGSNMSGKTTFIRSIGINALCGLSINTCFAESFAMPRLGIYSAIRISDDLLNDKSYYFEEVLRIKEMIEVSKEPIPHLFLLDEIYKGTNTLERIAAGKAVLSALQRGNNMVFVSTHDIELTELLKHEYDLYHFSELVQEGNVDFDYKLKEGKLTRRNAIRILEINGYPKELIEEAMRLVDKELMTD